MASARAIAFGERFGVARRKQESGDTVDDGFGLRAEARGDDRAAHRLRFDGDAAEGFGFDRGRDDHVGRHEGRGHIAAVAGDAHDLGEVQAIDGAQQFVDIGVAFLRVADHHGFEIAVRASFASASMKTSWPFQRVRRFGRTMTGLPGLQAPLFADGLDAIGRDVFGREGFDVDAARDDVELCLVDLVLGAGRDRPCSSSSR